MAITKTIGKNTIGDNNKMKVRLHDYEMSTHDLSTVFRSTMASGVLTPCLKLVAQKGDIFDIQMVNKTLTRPTLGPLFGAYKLQHFIFSVPFRLYNSWLHNNRTGIGLKMSNIKLPLYHISGAATERFNQSSLMAYMGVRGRRKSVTNSKEFCQGVPILGYIDIFKNYFANTQEDNFYMVTGESVPPTILTVENGGVAIRNVEIPTLATQTVNISVTSSSRLVCKSKVGGTMSQAKEWESVWKNVLVSINQGGTINDVRAWDLTTDATRGAISLNKIGTGSNILLTITYNKNNWFNDFPPATQNMTTFKLEDIDLLRDTILATKGNTKLNLNPGSVPENSGLNITTSIFNSRNANLGGLLLKTYDSDVFQNWVKTDWIDGENGISAITAVAVQNGTITIDSLNLQQKVYNMLNRIAVSGGTYRDWLETVYTTGNYMERPETPMFEGGMSQLIEFEEVISKSATADQPLGELAGRGVSSRPNGSGKLHFKVTEPGYIIGIAAITPMIDYSQGNEWDMMNLKTMDDLHKPALDGIGYEDSMNSQRAWWAKDFGTDIDTSAGKTVAWINYMTNFNRTFGNFASGGSEAFMCLNRNFERSSENKIADLTTYIDPAKHNEIFADTDLGSQNFWVQTAFNIEVRRNISAKQIPNI